MSPHFLPDSFVFCCRYPWQSYKVGDVVLVDHPHYGKMIKRIAHIKQLTATPSNNLSTVRINTIENILLVGDNAQSVTMEQMGKVSSTRIIGKVFYQVKPPQP